MKKSTHCPHDDAVLSELVAMRKKAGFTQRQLAAKLKREPSFVWRIEHGERRLDLVEFFWVCKTCDTDAAKVYARLVNRFKSLE